MLVHSLPFKNRLKSLKGKRRECKGTMVWSAKGPCTAWSRAKASSLTTINSLTQSSSPSVTVQTEHAKRSSTMGTTHTCLPPRLHLELQRTPPKYTVWRQHLQIRQLSTSWRESKSFKSGNAACSQSWASLESTEKTSDLSSKWEWGGSGQCQRHAI